MMLEAFRLAYFVCNLIGWERYELSINLKRFQEEKMEQLQKPVEESKATCKFCNESLLMTQLTWLIQSVWVRSLIDCLAVGGAAGGAAIGTMILPGVGTAIGAGVGAIGKGINWSFELNFWLALEINHNEFWLDEATSQWASIKTHVKLVKRNLRKIKRNKNRKIKMNLNEWKMKVWKSKKLNKVSKVLIAWTP